MQVVVVDEAAMVRDLEQAWHSIRPMLTARQGEAWFLSRALGWTGVAVKVSKTEFNERFDREAHAVAALNHSNTGTLHDVEPKIPLSIHTS